MKKLGESEEINPWFGYFPIRNSENKERLRHSLISYNKIKPNNWVNPKPNINEIRLDLLNNLLNIFHERHLIHCIFSGISYSQAIILSWIKNDVKIFSILQSHKNITIMDYTKGSISESINLSLKEFNKIISYVEIILTEYDIMYKDER